MGGVGVVGWRTRTEYDLMQMQMAWKHIYIKALLM